MILHRNRIAAVAILGCFTLAPQAIASILDTDFWCRTYGCVVVSDGQQYDIYDNWRFSTNSCCVPFGSPMISFYSRAGTPNITGSLTPFTAPEDTQSMMFGISEDGSNVSVAFIDDGDGYLDAGDSLSAFTLTPTTDVLLADDGRNYSHSFFISSRNTKFSVRALASIANSTGDFRDTLSLEDIQLTTSFRRSGNDGGLSFGSLTNVAGISTDFDIENLNDLSGIPTTLFDFSQQSGIRQRSGDLNDQTIRLDFLYEVPAYDLSMGVGSFNVDVVFDFYREP